MDKVRVQRLAEIAEKGDADIVLISSWKNDWKPNHHYPPIEKIYEEADKKGIYYNPVTGPPDIVGRYINNHLRKKGNGLKAIDKTIDIRPFQRGKGIVDWLNKHPEVTEWVILDDYWFDYDCFDKTSYHFHKINHELGLQDWDVEEAIAILKGERNGKGYSY